MMGRLRTFRYIPHALIQAAIAAGWLPCNAMVGTHHGEWSVLCEWLCDCAEPWPLDLVDFATPERA